MGMVSSRQESKKLASFIVGGPENSRYFREVRRKVSHGHDGNSCC